MRVRDRKKLWGYAGARCSICRADASENGVEAHIHARSQGGPRWDASLSSDQREGYGNRILLCPNCHDIVDSDAEKWTADQLRKAKAAHEDWVQTSGQAVTELDGEIVVKAPEGDDIAGVRTKKPTRFKPGTRVRVDAPGARRVTGVEIGGDDE